MIRRPLIALLFTAASAMPLLTLTSCSSKSDEQLAKDHHATHLENHECAACGMIIREQPAPRAQLIHRDGTHLHFCSISDMITYLDAPSPHGKAISLFVESLDTVVDPIANTTEELPWLDATSSSYVIGIDKKMVMGRPILSYSTPKKAKSSAAKTSGTVVTWLELLAKKSP